MKTHPDTAPNIHRRGFTLVEMIVSLGIFAIVAVVALGALTKIITANQKGQSLQSSMTNINFGLESMAREIRTGGNYYCTTSTGSQRFGNGGALTHLRTQGCPINTDSSQPALIAFTSSKTADDGAGTCNLVYVYRFIRDTAGVLRLQKAEQQTCGQPVTLSLASTDAENLAVGDLLSSSNIVLTDYRLGVGPYDGANADGTYISASAPYPRVYIRLGGYAGAREREKTYFDIQTTISARVPKQ